jgi:hypothetical protein
VSRLRPRRHDAGPVRPDALHARRQLSREHRVQQPVLRLPGDEARAELGQHAEVEPRVGELKPECILPIDPGTHGIGRLPVAEMLEELEHRDQRQPPRRQARLTSGRVKRGKVLVLVKRAELVAQPHDHGTFGKGRAGNARSTASPKPASRPSPSFKRLPTGP